MKLGGLLQFLAAAYSRVVRLTRPHALSTDGARTAAWRTSFEPGADTEFVKGVETRKSDIFRVSVHIFITD
jgi:hypothetical protein